MLPGSLIVLVFLILAGLMMTRKMPALLALPIMAVVVGLIAGVAAGLPLTAVADATKQVPPNLRDFIFNTILTDGATFLALPIMFAAFGAILSQVVMRQGIAQRLVRVAAEFAGDRKMVLACVMTAVVAVSFMTLTGLGAVIMVGSLALPIMIGAGISPSFAACLMLFAFSIGGSFNFANLGQFMKILNLTLDQVKPLAIAFGLLLGATTVAFMFIEGRHERRRFTWALDVGSTPQSVPLPALLTPLVPIGLILAFSWQIIPAFIAGILYGLLTTEPLRVISNMTACVLEGLKDVSPVIGLFVGIGMVFKSMTDPTTQVVMHPFMSAITPHSPIGFLLFFTILAPLALYRGPMNFFGLGAGVAGLMLQTGLLPASALLAGFMAVGQIQGVCDPTNTSNVWLAQFTHGSTEDFMKRTLPYVWAFVLVALLYAVFIGKVI